MVSLEFSDVWSWNPAGARAVLSAVLVLAVFLWAVRRVARALTAATARARRAGDAVLAAADSLAEVSRNLGAIAEELRSRQEAETTAQARRVGLSRGDVFSGDAFSGIGGIAMAKVSNYSDESVYDVAVTLTMAGPGDPPPVERHCSVLGPGHHVNMSFPLRPDDPPESRWTFTALFTDARGRRWRRVTSDPLPHPHEPATAEPHSEGAGHAPA